MLGKSPAFAVVAILSLAIGIGANSAIFSVANALILRPLPYTDAHRIAIVWQRSPGLNVPRDWLSIGQYVDIRMGSTAFEQVAAAIGASFNVTGEGAGRPERVDGMRVSSSFFSLFGARAAMGRVFGPDDDVAGRSPNVILTHGYWQRRFGGDRGECRRLAEHPHAVPKVVAPCGHTSNCVVVPRDAPFPRHDFHFPN